MVVYEAVKKYEGRVQQRALAETLELAKNEARNWVLMHEPPEWKDYSPDWDHMDIPRKSEMENVNSDVEIKIKRRGVISEGSDNE